MECLPPVTPSTFPRSRLRRRIPDLHPEILDDFTRGQLRGSANRWHQRLDVDALLGHRPRQRASLIVRIILASETRET
jgi:hypothetical protein